MVNLNKQDIEFLIDCLKNGKEIPEVYKYAIFPTKQKEYELVYAGKMRKEDVLADTEEAKPVPLQIEKVFNGKKYPLYSKDWHNLLVFGDNLQILKTFDENKDPLVKNKIRGKVKLIYIDPPFGTGDEYDGAKGQSAYSAKKKGADFVEFLRRRLILLKELMANDGAIFIRMDYHFGHYIKLVMDEVFDKGSFKNEIIIKRGYVPKGKTSQFPTATDSLFFYSKTDIFNLISNTKSIEEKDRKWISLDMPGERKDRNIKPRIFLGKKLYPPKGQHWGLSQERISELEKQGDIRINAGRTYTDTEGKTVKGMPEFLKEPFVLLNSNWTDIKI